MCEISCKNSERLLRKWQKTLGDTFLPHTVECTEFTATVNITGFTDLLQAECRLLVYTLQP